MNSNIKKHIFIFFIILIIYFGGYYLLFECFDYSVGADNLGHGFIDYAFCLIAKLFVSIIISSISLFVFLVLLILKKFSKKLFFISLYLTVALNAFITIVYINGYIHSFVQVLYNFVLLTFVDLPIYIPLVILYYILLLISNLQDRK